MGTILLWITGALIFGLVCKYLSLPVVVGFIAVGYCFGTTPFTDNEEILTVPSEIGVELLLFSLGLKIKPSSFLNPDLILVFLMGIKLLKTPHHLVLCSVMMHPAIISVSYTHLTLPTTPYV